MTNSEPRRAYDDPDTAHDMARDASACRSEAHLAFVRGSVALGRHAAGQVPEALRREAGQLSRTAVSVSDSAVRLATRLLD